MAHSHLTENDFNSLSCKRHTAGGLVAVICPREGGLELQDEAGGGVSKASQSAPFQTSNLGYLSACLHFLVIAAGRKQLGGVQCWHCVTAGPLGPPSCFQRLEATGACHRKQGNGFHTLQETRDVTG